MKILNFGSCNIDFVYSVKNMVLPGETISADNVERFPGGKGLNQSIAFAKAGAHVYHAGCIGSDGIWLRELMESVGVNTGYLRQIDFINGQAFIQLAAGGENAIVVYSGANGRITRAYVDEVLQNFSNGDFLILQNEINGVPYIVDKAYEKGMKIVLNPSPFNEKIKDIPIGKITYLIVNEHEAKALSGIDDENEFAEWCTQNYPELCVVLTLGENGSMYFDKNQRLFQPSFEVDVVDTTAAGDTFTGYFFANICKGVSPEDSLKYASAASALTVSSKGAASSIPTGTDVNKKIDTMAQKTVDKKSDFENRVQKYIGNNYYDANVDSLAKVVGYSRPHTIKRLKNDMGTTFSELVIAQRCKVAADLLKNTDMAVSDIIEKIGYKNENFFRKKFSSIYGCSPLSYRKKK